MSFRIRLYSIVCMSGFDWLLSFQDLKHVYITSREKKLLQKHISKVKTSWREKWTPSSQRLQMSSSKSERMISPCLPHLSTSRFFCPQTAELDPLTNLPVRYRRHSVAHQVLEVVVENTLGLQPPCYATYLHKGSTIPLFLLKRIVASTYRHRGSKMPPPLNNILNRIDIHRYTYISYMFFWHWHLGIHNSHTTLGRADFRSQHFFLTWYNLGDTGGRIVTCLCVPTSWFLFASGQDDDTVKMANFG